LQSTTLNEEESSRGNPVPIKLAEMPPLLPLAEGVKDPTVMLTKTGTIFDVSAYPIE
jgi:hypothetical protein